MNGHANETEDIAQDRPNEDRTWNRWQPFDIVTVGNVRIFVHSIYTSLVWHTDARKMREK